MFAFEKNVPEAFPVRISRCIEWQTDRQAFRKILNAYSDRQISEIDPVLKIIGDNFFPPIKFIPGILKCGTFCFTNSVDSKINFFKIKTFISFENINFIYAPNPTPTARPSEVFPNVK